MMFSNPNIDRAFVECFNIAGSQIQRAAANCGMLFWLKSTPFGPYLEHLSFRIEAEIYFVRIVDVDGLRAFPGSVDGLLRIAQGYRSHACYFPVKFDRNQKRWNSAFGGWGLVDALTGARVDPALDLEKHRHVEMTDWELQDFAVQVVRDSLKNKGYVIESSNSDPEVDPSIWFREKTVGIDGMEYVVVRVCRDESMPMASMHIEEMKEALTQRGYQGHYAEVIVHTDNEGHVWRGRPIDFDYGGLSKLPDLN